MCAWNCAIIVRKYLWNRFVAFFFSFYDNQNHCAGLHYSPTVISVMYCPTLKVEDCLLTITISFFGDK